VTGAVGDDNNNARVKSPDLLGFLFDDFELTAAAATRFVCQQRACH